MKRFTFFIFIFIYCITYSQQYQKDLNNSFGLNLGVYTGGGKNSPKNDFSADLGFSYWTNLQEHVFSGLTGNQLYMNFKYVNGKESTKGGNVGYTLYRGVIFLYGGEIEVLNNKSTDINLSPHFGFYLANPLISIRLAYAIPIVSNIVDHQYGRFTIGLKFNYIFSK